MIGYRFLFEAEEEMSEAAMFTRPLLLVWQRTSFQANGNLEIRHAC